MEGLESANTIFALPCEALSISQFRTLGKSQRLCYTEVIDESLLFNGTCFTLSHTFLLKSISLFTLKAQFHLAASEIEDVLGSRTGIGLHLILHWNNGCQQGFYKLSWKLNIDNIGCRGIKNTASQINVCSTICTSTYVYKCVHTYVGIYKNLYICTYICYCKLLFLLH